MTEIATILGPGSLFSGDADPRAPHVRALDWIHQHAGSYDLATAPDDRAFVLIDLTAATAQLAVTREGEARPVLSRRIDGAALGEVLEAGAALAALYPVGEIPDAIDLDGERRRLVTFMGGMQADVMLTAWEKLRNRREML